MFDTMKMTKLAGSLFGALLVFLLVSWLSDEIYKMEAGHGSEGEGQAYTIATGAEEDAAPAEEEAVDFATLYAAADIDKGAKVFGKCSACHKAVAGENAVGPYLYGVVGRPVDAADGYTYSGALELVVQEWTPENLYAFLESPRSYAPGTAMAFNGLNKSEDRINVIAYLDSLDGDMIEPAPAAASEEEAAVQSEPAVVEDAAVEDAASVETATETTATETATEKAVAAEQPEAPAAEAPAAAEETAAVEQPAATEETAAVEQLAATEETAAVEAPAATEETTVAEAPAAAEEAAAAEPAATDTASGFAVLVAAADVDAGAKVFSKCKACHVLEAGKNRVGPYLHGVVGRDIASAEGFKYSETLLGMDDVWTYDALNGFLENPRGYAEGTKMGFAGLKKEEDRANVIAYIESQSK